MKKIVVLIAHLGNGGAERVSVNLANEFCKHENDVYAIVFHKGTEEYVLDSRVNKIYLEDTTHSNKIGKIINLRKVLSEIRPDFVIELGFAMRYILIGGLLNKYKYIVSMRNDPYMEMRNSKSIFKYFHKYYFKHAYRVVFQTEDAKAFYPEAIQSKGVIIPNPIKDDLPEPFTGKREHIIIAFSRLSKQKNIPMMLEAFKIFHEKYPDYQLRIYGRGEEQDYLEKYSNRIGIDSAVQFCGFSTDIHNEILTSMMYVSSSDYEGISNSMIEAFGIGLPCICTDCPAGGAKMFIQNGVNGYLVPVGDKNALAERMIYLASHTNICEEFSKNAVKIRKTLRTEIICEQWERLMD